jgi:hypothetical protein
MHHLLRRHRGPQLAGLRLTPTWIGIAFGLAALAVGSAVCAAKIGAKRRRDKDEDAQRVATWEGEGGAPSEPAVAH